MDNYTPQAIKDITKGDIEKISDKLNLKLNSTECDGYKDIINNLNELVSKLYLLEEEKLISNFPRLEISNKNNPFNSYSCQCILKGSDEGWLAGKTLAIKDNVMIAGLPLSNGSHLLDGYIPDQDATIVSRILKNGGNIKGKAKCEDLCFSANNFSCMNGPCVNPIDKTKSTGGSSSGSAALVKGGIVDITVGGDQGGSIRIPAASCGIMGFKTTYGLIPMTGCLGIEYTLDHIGPLGNTTEDIARFLNACAGPDGLDNRYFTYLNRSIFSIDNLTNKDGKTEWEIGQNIYYGICRSSVDYQAAWENYKTLFSKNLKIGVFSKVIDKCDDVIKNGFMKIKNQLVSNSKELHYNVEEFKFNKFQTLQNLFFAIICMGFYDNEITNDSTPNNTFNHHNTGLAKFIHSSKQTNLKDISHTNKAYMVFAEYIKSNYGNKFYTKLRNIRKELTDEFIKAFDGFDLIIMPTIMQTPPELTKKDCTIDTYFKDAFTNCGLTSPFNLLGLPAFTIDLDKGGSICPVMVVGKHFEDHRVLQFARYLETFNK
jgi:amidase